MRVYIASPYTIGDKEDNVRKQIDTFSELINRGYTPFAPLLSHFVHTIHPKCYETWMDWDFTWIKQCDVVLRLPGCSSGADREVEFAKSIGVDVVYSIEELENLR